jgi:hypothetical protein
MDNCISGPDGERTWLREDAQRTPALQFGRRKALGIFSFSLALTEV